MNKRELLIAFLTILNKEITRFVRIWPQTFIPIIITTTLYFLIFGKIVGSQIDPISGYNYMEYIMPGLVMMSIINSSYSNTVSSFFSAKFQKSIEEILVSPTPHYVIIIGYVAGGVLRGLISGLIVYLVASLFVKEFIIYSITNMILSALFSAIIFANIGLLNGLFARNFDDISWVPSFVLTPLSYLGGIFYSISSLPYPWAKISLFNPIFYCVDMMRYSILGIHTMNVSNMLYILAILIVIIYAVSLKLFKYKISK
jgi:ABC-2 type transport system permease protein